MRGDTKNSIAIDDSASHLHTPERSSRIRQSLKSAERKKSWKNKTKAMMLFVRIILLTSWIGWPDAELACMHPASYALVLLVQEIHRCARNGGRGVCGFAWRIGDVGDEVVMDLVEGERVYLLVQRECLRIV